MQSPPQYPGAPYYPMATENLLKKRYVLALNALGLLATWLATIIVIWTNDLNARGFARFLTISGGLIADFGSIARAPGSKRTSAHQHIGLPSWTGIVYIFSVAVLS